MNLKYRFISAVAAGIGGFVLLVVVGCHYTYITLLIFHFKFNGVDGHLTRDCLHIGILREPLDQRSNPDELVAVVCYNLLQ